MGRLSYDRHRRPSYDIMGPFRWVPARNAATVWSVWLTGSMARSQSMAAAIYFKTATVISKETAAVLFLRHMLGHSALGEIIH